MVGAGAELVAEPFINEEKGTSGAIGFGNLLARVKRLLPAAIGLPNPISLLKTTFFAPISLLTDLDVN